MSHNFDLNNQKKLMELVVGQVLKKHNVTKRDIQLSKKEKKEIKEIVANIENEVQRFLENQNKQFTEKDFATENTSKEPDDMKKTSPLPEPQQLRRVFQSTNDVKSVKTFLNSKRKK